MADAVHAWDRFDRMWVGIFHVAIAVPTVMALVSSGADPVRWAAIVAGAAVVVGGRALAARALAGVPEGSGRHVAVGLLWAAVTLPCLVLLYDAESAFFFAVYGLFPQAFILLPRNWAVVVAAAIVPTVLIGSEGVSALDEPGFLVSVVGSALLAPAIGLFIHAISRQSGERHAAILALEAAQEEAKALLDATLAISRARSAGALAAAVGECLVGHGVERVRVYAGNEPVGEWNGGTPGSEPTTVRVETIEVWSSAPLNATAQRTLETLATSCGLALENFRLVEQARETGVLEERGRLAREIHDTLAQGFVSILTQLEAAGEALERAPAEVAERVDRASRIARASLGEARRSMQALRPAALESAPLSEAIERVAARWSGDSSVPADVKVTGDPVPLPPDTEITLLRAAQEALANVARHAQATSVTVTLSFLDDAVVLDVHDDGRGFDLAAPRNGSGGGFGLEALRQRVSGAGGFFDVESEPGGGTTVTVHVPVPAAAAPS